MPVQIGPFLPKIPLMLYYRSNIIGNENAPANSEKHNPPYKNLNLDSYQSYRTVPYYSTTYDVGPYCVRDNTVS